MKIHFCDLCNESVPQSDLDAGRARVVKGRTICSACESAMSHGEPAAAAAAGSTAAAGGATTLAPSPARPQTGSGAGDGGDGVRAPAGTGAVWAAGLAVAFTALAIFVTDDRLAALGREQSSQRTEGERRAEALRSLQNEIQTVHPALAAVEARIAERFDAQAARAVALGEAVTALREDQARLQGRLEALGGEVERLRALVERPGVNAELERRFDELTARIARAEDERRTLAKSLAEIPAPAAKAAEPAPAPSAPAWHKSLPDLKSPEESLRWEAVTALGAAGDAAAVDHIVPMLADPSVFVRMAAARVLGEMRARQAIPNLIDALEDPDSAVRETAWIALRTVSGKDLKFDPYASDAERGKRVKAWREWWRKEAPAPADQG